MAALHLILLVLQIDSSEYAVPASDVELIESFNGATRVPGAPNFIVGVTQIRQRLIPVLDLRLRFGLEPRVPSLENRIVVLRAGERRVGLLVDRARELVTLDEAQLQAAPEVAAISTGGFVKSLAQLKNRIVMLLDSEKVIGEEAIHA